MMAKKFRYKYYQTQFTFAVSNTITEWAIFKAIFGLNDIKKVCIAWQNMS